MERLRNGPASAGASAEQFQFSTPTIGHQLDLLRQAELVTSQKQEQFVVHTLSTTVFDKLLGRLIQVKS